MVIGSIPFTRIAQQYGEVITQQPTAPPQAPDGLYNSSKTGEAPGVAMPNLRKLISYYLISKVLGKAILLESQAIINTMVRHCLRNCTLTRIGRFPIIIILQYILSKHQGPVVQNLVSLTSSLRPQLVLSKCRLHQQIHCYFLLIKCENPLQCKGFSHFFNKN